MLKDVEGTVTAQTVWNRLARSISCAQVFLVSHCWKRWGLWMNPGPELQTCLEWLKKKKKKGNARYEVRKITFKEQRSWLHGCFAQLRHSRFWYGAGVKRAMVRGSCSALLAEGSHQASLCSVSVKEAGLVAGCAPQAAPSPRGRSWKRSDQSVTLQCRLVGFIAD